MRNINPFGLRMQPDLRAKIEAAAELNHRSLNAEIVARLEESFAGSTPPPTSEAAPPAEQDAKEVIQQLQEIAQMFREAAEWLPKKKE